MEHTPFTNQSFLEDPDPQEIEVENDPELAAIAAQLQATASYAVNPTFKEELRKRLLHQFINYCTGETN